MKASSSLSLLLLVVPLCANAEVSPVGKVVSMISELEAKIIKEGEVAHKVFAKYAEWCEDRARNLGFEIKTGKADVESLEASIAQETARMAALATKMDELAASIATDEADLKAAVAIRGKENADFIAEEHELTDIIEMLRRAIGILEREMHGGASMMQTENVKSLTETVSVMLQASLISSADASKLTAFVQDTQKSDDDAPGAPAGAVYESQSGNIVEVLTDLMEKAESQLADARQKETSNVNNFEMLKQSLQDELKFAAKSMAEAKSNSAGSSEQKSTAQGELGVTSKDLAEDVQVKATLHHDCMTKAETYEAETKSRGEELKALAQAKQVIKEATSLAQVSLLQVSSAKLASGTDLANFEAVRLVRDLARKQHSSALAQLASRMASAMQSRDHFAKIKGLIADMISKLESEADADATEKAYCDKELAYTNGRKSDKTAEIKKLSTRIDAMNARSAQLKGEIATLQNELAKLAKSQADMDTMRHEEKAAFEDAKAELHKGLTGIRMALKILNEYYSADGKAHAAAEGAATGIIGLLEVIEADFSKNLAQVTSDEDIAVASYERNTKDNEIEKTTKDQDVKYKSKEAKDLDKSSAELNADRDTVQQELDAVLEYLSKLEERCIARAETFEARRARYEAEVTGLKEALQILETETALVQRRSRHALRGRHA